MLGEFSDVFQIVDIRLLTLFSSQQLRVKFGISVGIAPIEVEPGHTKRKRRRGERGWPTALRAAL